VAVTSTAGDKGGSANKDDSSSPRRYLRVKESRLDATAKGNGTSVDATERLLNRSLSTRQAWSQVAAGRSGGLADMEDEEGASQEDSAMAKH
jgi:hypothetical protein